METEISNPREYIPEEEHIDETSTPIQYMYEPQPTLPPVMPQMDVKQDVFANLDRTAYIIIFVAFILGFFMGKTMQPVILRPN